MITQPPRERPWVSWLLFFACAAVVFATVPFARTLRNLVIERWGRPAFAYAVAGCVVVSLMVLLRRLRRAAALKPVGILWLMVVSAVYLFWTAQLAQESPEEAVHFLEYALLSLLAFRALSHDLRDPAIYLGAALLCAAAGTVDEFIQWLTPRRVWEMRDVGINAASAALMQLAIAFGIRPPYIALPIRRASIARVSRIALVLLVLIGLCLINTPPRVAWMAARFPALRALLLRAGSMTEYGHLIRDAEIGVFYSRFSREQLRQWDEQHGVAAAKVLDAFQGEERYPGFLNLYPPAVDPFIHEARVHLFRRDRYRKRENQFADAERRQFFRTVAFRENLIMEKFFPVTLAASGYILEAGERQRLESEMDRSLDYASAVSEHLIVRVEEYQVWVALLLVAVALLVAGARAERQAGRAAESGKP
jgi:hypothetical protein